MIGISTYPKSAVQNKQMHYSPNLLSTVNNGIDNTKVAVIEYDSNQKGISIREIEPMAIVYKDGKRHLVGWCRLRNDYRSFRLDRLNCVKLKQEEFSRRSDFDITAFQDDLNASYDDNYEEQD